MNEKTATEVRLEALEDDRREDRADIRALERRIGFLERAIWWAIGAGTGIGALATSMVSGVLKRISG